MWALMGQYGTQPGPGPNPDWAPFVYGGYVLIGGMDVINENIETGVFLSNLSVLKDIGMVWNNIYKEFLLITAAWIPMNTVAYLLNLVDENPLRLAISRRQQESRL